MVKLDLQRVDSEGRAPYTPGRLMRGKRSIRGFGLTFGVVGVLFLSGVSSAQEQEKGAAPVAAPQLNSQRDVKLSPQEMKKRADKYMPQMAQGANTVRKQLAEARQSRDVVKVLCLNDKLNQIDTAIRSARDRMPNLKTAAEKNDQDQARHEFTTIEVLKDRVQNLVAEANQCIGEETGFVGESEVVVDIDPTIPDDPSKFPDDPLISQPPVTGSPVL